MNQIRAILLKELRSHFTSPVAVLFLGVFLLTVSFTFFWVEQFFARNLPDVRPLFEWLPVLLVFLCAALTMRQWSEEQKLGTLEVLLTLPVPLHRLVLGKFFGGLALVGLALAMTLGLPLTVAQLGDLDWGPVVGGYVGALLLGAAYLAIGLCISATTDNQIVALLITMLACAALYLPGSEVVLGLVGHDVAEILRALGSGSRFESIARGVIDLRDVVYYLAVTALFLLLNVGLLAAKRWSHAESARPQRRRVQVLLALGMANAVAANLWLAPIAGARLDMTARGDFSLAPATDEILGALEEPLLIRGYFSERTHPLLAPLVPQIRDRLAEYDVAGGAKVSVEFVDPRVDEAVEKEAREIYGIKSVPFQVADRHESAVVNSFFHVLVKYGDQYEVLGFDDLIEIKVSGMDDIDVKLRNIEYDLTRAIKKVSLGFQSIESAFASMAEDAVLTVYLTPKTLPPEYVEVPARIEKVAQELVKRSGGKLRLTQENPDTPEAQEQLYQRFGMRPYAVSLMSEQVFFMHLSLQVGERIEPVLPAEDMEEADIRVAVEDAIRRSAPGFLKTVGLVTPEPAMDPMMMQMGGPPPSGPKAQLLRAHLGDGYRIKDVDLSSGAVPGDVDVLLLAGPEALDESSQFAVDQFLMRGGPTIVLAGHAKLASGKELGVSVLDTGLAPALEAWGVKIRDRLVLDPQNEAFPVPVQRDLGGMVVEEIRSIPYPFFVDVRGDGIREDEPMVHGLPAVTLQWASPLTLVAGETGETSDGEAATGESRKILLTSSDKAWLQAGTDVEPDFERSPELGFAAPDRLTPEESGAQPLAVAISGTIPSFFAGKVAPEPAAPDPEESPEQPTRRKHVVPVIEQSPPTGKLVVVGSSSFVDDEVLNLSRQSGSERFLNNLVFVHNLVDWAVADTQLMGIRARGSYTRTLDVSAEERKEWEWINYGIIAALMAALVGWTRNRRRSEVPLIPAPTSEKAKAA